MLAVARKTKVEAESREDETQVVQCFKNKECYGQLSAPFDDSGGLYYRGSHFVRGMAAAPSLLRVAKPFRVSEPGRVKNKYKSTSSSSVLLRPSLF